MRIRSSLLLMGAIILSGLGFSTQSALANTIQPIFMSVSGPVAGQYTYVYDLQLTPNNGLTNDPTYPSMMVIVDIGTVTSTSLSTLGGGLMGADVTSVGDWSTNVTATGTGGVSNTSYVPTTLTVSGSGNSATASDFNTASNVTVVYSGGGLGSSLSQRSLVQLTIVTNFVPGPVLQSLSRNTALGTVNQADTFPVLTTNTVPIPAAAWAGFSMLAGLGAFGTLRRRRMA